MPFEGEPAEVLVRPRFTDGTFDSPLLLEEHFAERFLSGKTRPTMLFIEGPRGSGLTTALACLARRAEGTADRPLFFDLSRTPLAREKRRNSVGRKSLPEAIVERGAVIAGTELERFSRAFERLPGREGCSIEHLRLAPWGEDELLELLSTPPYIEHRARLSVELKSVPRLAPLLEHPRTARWMVDAATTIPEGEPITISKLYAAFLDSLPEEAIEAIRLSMDAGLDLRKGVEPPLRELLVTIFLHDPYRLPSSKKYRALVAQASRKISAHFRSAGLRYGPAFALEGLDHFLAAGACLKKIATGEVPKPIGEDLLPFLIEMMTPGLKERLRAWLSQRDGPDPSCADSVAATILHACGETPQLDSKARPHDLHEAILDGLDARGVDLHECRFERAHLGRACFESANLTGASFVKTKANGANFDRACLSRARFSAELRGASFRRANANETATFEMSYLDGACFAEAQLTKAAFVRSSLDRADFREATLVGSRFVSVLVAGADFSGACLVVADLRDVDFTEARLAGAVISKALFAACRFAELELDGIEASRTRFEVCDLSATTFRRAHLEGATFSSCRAHDASFEEADLRRAIFDAVSFHAGSSRAGLLLDKPALEGNMTGFYREGTTDDAWASPESIRQASFRGADLRGARFADTNLFRVDFRGATLDPDLLDEARKQGALLD